MSQELVNFLSHNSFYFQPSPSQEILPTLYYFFSKFEHENVMIFGDSHPYNRIRYEIAHDMAVGFGKNVNYKHMIDLNSATYDFDLSTFVKLSLYESKFPSFIIILVEKSEIVYSTLESEIWSKITGDCEEKKKKTTVIDLTEYYETADKDIICGCYSSTQFYPDITNIYMATLKMVITTLLNDKYYYTSSFFQFFVIINSLSSLDPTSYLGTSLMMQLELLKLKIDLGYVKFEMGTDNNVKVPLFAIFRPKDSSDYKIIDEITQGFAGHPWRTSYTFHPQIICDLSNELVKQESPTMRIIGIYTMNYENREESMNLIYALEIAIDQLNTNSKLTETKYSLTIVLHGGFEDAKIRLDQLLPLEEKIYAIFGLREYLFLSKIDT